jgi:hypothetical protein
VPVAGVFDTEGKIGDTVADRPDRFPDARDGNKVLTIRCKPVDEVTITALEREAMRDRDALLHEREKGRIDSILQNFLRKVPKCSFAVSPVIRVGNERTGWREGLHDESLVCWLNLFRIS